MNIASTTILKALRDWVGISLAVASGVALVAGKLASVQAPLGVSPSIWAYVAAVGVGAQLIVVALTKFSSILGSSQVYRAAILAASRDNAARMAAGKPTVDEAAAVKTYLAAGIGIEFK